MSIIAIACVDANWGIGYQDELLEHIPADMKFFKETTIGNYVVMGRKTWESLPKKPLEDRDNIVITSSLYLDSDYDRTIFTSLSQVIKFINSDIPERDIYIIGGASIYEQLLPYCDKVYITHVYIPHDNVDAYFPNLNEMSEEWELAEESPFSSYNGFCYSFKIYSRKSN